jgi:hypothetical protein
MDRTFETVFKKIYGKPCWGVSPGVGSFLTLNFGEPHLEIREPIVAGKGASARVRGDLARRAVRVHGEWQLWLTHCNWEILAAGKRVGDGSTKMKVQRAADFLNGQKLLRFSISTTKGETVFDFDLGATLKTRPYDRKSEQWLLFTPSRTVLTARADLFYKYERADLPNDAGVWKPIRAISR